MIYIRSEIIMPDGYILPENAFYRTESVLHDKDMYCVIEEDMLLMGSEIVGCDRWHYNGLEYRPLIDFTGELHLCRPMDDEPRYGAYFVRGFLHTRFELI